MRLFTGIDLPDDVKGHLDILISRLRAHAHVKWSPAYNLHLTTKFIGEWPAERLAELDTALRGIRIDAPIQIDVRGIGWFPNPRHPRVLWAGITATSTLAELARLTENTLVALGVKPEDRDFSPHLTLARIKEPVPLHALQRAISELESVEFGKFMPACFHLYRSEPGPTGSIYTKLQEYPLPLS